MNEKTSYPLTWPDGRGRTPSHLRKHAQFQTLFAKARDNLMKEIHRLGGRDIILSSDIPLKQDGMPFANMRPKSGDPGIAVYFMRNKKQLCFACDCYQTPDDNLHAIALTIAALRGIARWGTGDMMEAAFRGFTALPETTSGISWWSVLGVPINATAEQVKDAYFLLVKKYHPDGNPSGGDEELLRRVITAYEMFEATQKA